MTARGSEPDDVLIRVCDLAGRPRGTGFLADGAGTMITSHEAVDGLARLVLHAPGEQVCLVEAEAITALPEYGLALVATEGLTLPPLPVAPGGPAHPEGRIRLRLPQRTEGAVVGTAAVTYTATDRFHLLDEVYELALDGTDMSRVAPQASGAPLIDAATGAVLAVVVTALHAGHRAGGFAVPLRTGGAPGPLADLLARNAKTVPAYGPHLNLAGALQLTATSVGSAIGPGQWREPIARPGVADAMREFLSLRGEYAPLVLGLVGEPGTGRSTELAGLAARRSHGPQPAPTVWLRGAELRPGDGGIKDAVERSLRSAARIVCAAAARGSAGTGYAPPALSASDPTDAVAALARAAGRPLLVLLDAPEEMPPVLAHTLSDWAAGTARWLRAGRVRLIVACRPEFWEQAGAALPGELLYGAARRPAGPAAGAPVRALPVCVRLGDLTDGQAARARARFGLPPGALSPRDDAHPLAMRLLAEVRAALPEDRTGELDEEPPPSRAEVFSAHLDLVCLRIAVRLAAAAEPPVRGGGVRRLAARVAGQVHEAARRCLGPGQGELDRETFEELFPWRTGWASAVLTEGLLVPAGAGYRFTHEEAADWLQARHLDLDAALHALVHRWFATPGPPAEAAVRLPSRPTTRAGHPPPVPPAPPLAPATPRSLPVPRHRAGPVVQALLLSPAPTLVTHLRALIAALAGASAVRWSGPPGAGGGLSAWSGSPEASGAGSPSPVAGQGPARAPGTDRGGADSLRGGVGSEVGVPVGARPTPPEVGPSAWPGSSGVGSASSAGGPGSATAPDPSAVAWAVPPAAGSAAGVRSWRWAGSRGGPEIGTSPSSVPGSGSAAEGVGAGFSASAWSGSSGWPAAWTSPSAVPGAASAVEGAGVVPAAPSRMVTPADVAGVVSHGLPAEVDLDADTVPNRRARPGAPQAEVQAEVGRSAGRREEAVWWGVHLVREVLLRVGGAAPYRAVLRELAGRIVVRAVEGGGFGGAETGGLAEFGPWFWRRVPLGVGERLELLRLLLPADGPPGKGEGEERFLDVVAELLREEPAEALPAVCRWFGDDRPLQTGPGPEEPRLTVASAAQALLHTHRRLAVDDLTEALVAAAHPSADELLAALAEDETSAVCRAVDRWAHDPRPDRHVAAATYGRRAAPFVRSAADRELLRYAALAILARPGDCSLHGASLGLLVRDPATRSRHLPAALRHFAAADPQLPPGALAAALSTHPEPVLAAFQSRLRTAAGDATELLAELAGITGPALARRAATLVADHLLHRPDGAEGVARYLDLRLEQGPAVRAVLLPLAAALLRDHPPRVRRALVPVFAAPGTHVSRPLRQELLDAVLDTERDPDVLDALLAAAAEGCRRRPPPLTRDLVHRLGLLLGRTPEGAAHFDRRVVELAAAEPEFARLLRAWLADGGSWDAVIGPSARRRLDLRGARAGPAGQSAEPHVPEAVPAPVHAPADTAEAAGNRA